jgi:Tol biopolymer transport system component
MVLSSGTRVGPYEILAPLGAGGMGEVYRARDPRLQREVAIKVLREEAIAAGDRRRIETEARAAGSLNHPNILTIYDIGEESGTPYIVSELLEGEPLRALLPGSPLPVRKLLDIAVQIAAGLAAAHAHRLTHRDLKPENIMVLRDGRVKVLDFGLARPEPTAETDQRTRTAPGLVAGTLAYMSPEQAQGEPVDFRSDQFSFGSILYEMAGGRHPFLRKDRVSTLAAIVGEEPAPIGASNALIPPPLRWAIDRCLAKEPGRRYASTADLCQQLQDMRDHLSEISTGGPVAALPPRLRRGKRLLWAGIGLAALAAGFAGAALVLPHYWRTPVRHYTPFATEAIDETEPAWSPDGRALAYTAAADGVMQVFARNLDSPVPARITAAPANCRYPFWAPDGSRIYYWSASSLWSVGAAGGAPQEVIRGVAGAGPPAAISPDGKVMAFFRVEGAQSAVYFMPFPGGTAAACKRPPFPASFRFSGGMRFSADGRKLLVWVVPDVDKGVELWLLPLPAGTPRRIPADLETRYRVISASWMPDNAHIALATEISPGEGSHVYRLDTGTGALEPVTSGTGAESEPAVSPDGNRMAFVTGEENSDLLEVSLDGSTVRPLLVTSRHEHDADWSPSGRQFVYTNDAAGVPEIWLRSTDEGWARPVVRGAAEGYLNYAAPRFSPDGQRLAYMRVGAKHLVWICNISGGNAVQLEQESVDQHAPAWSPDGNWIVYTRYFAQKWEIAKAPSGGGGRPAHIAGGGNARSKLEWSRSGAWIAFDDPDNRSVFAVSPDGGAPRLVCSDAAAFTFTRDGSGLYVARRLKDRKWELATIGVPDGVQVKTVPLNVSPESGILGLKLHPDGKRFAVSVMNRKRDIWVLDGLGARPALRWFGR